jgi:hypothetical protein
MAAGLESGNTGIQVRFSRITLHVRKHADRNFVLANALDDARDQIGVCKAPIGYQQRPGNAVAAACVGKLGNAPGTRDDACREIPGSGDQNCHVVLSVFDAKVK